MARRRSRKKKIPETIFTADIDSLSHEGRGITRTEDGKLVFVAGALAGENVDYQLVYTRAKFDEAVITAINTPSPDRITPACEHADICGGCSLQHMSNEAQIAFKQKSLHDHFTHFGNVEPKQWLPPLLGDTLGYRRKARLGAKFVEKKGGGMVGFREKRSSYLADIQSCAVLHPEVGNSISALRELIGSLDAKACLPQIEVAIGDDTVSLNFRHLEALSDADTQRLIDFCQQREWHCYLQPKGPMTVHRIYPESTGRDADRLSYALPNFGLTMNFHPTDFTQVNSSINRPMLKLALDMLQVTPNSRVLDLFCGLGNFTLPLATQAQHVVGVEGSEEMVKRGYENARLNGLDNVDFHAADLSKDIAHLAWAQKDYDRILLDPARSGALEVIPHLKRWLPERIVYVSCNPATLARDAKAIIDLGYTLETAGVMDMFPHTAHVESIALFIKQ